MTRIFAILIVSVIFCGCSNRKPVPRREAYPRVQLLDTVMVAAEAPAYFLVNSQARVEQSREDWLTVAYDTYGATMYVTFTETLPSSVDEVKRNRMERLLLNSGEQLSHHSEFTTSYGYDVVLSYSEGTATPLQFIATDNSSMVVSGAVYFANPKAPEAVDSITPVIDALRGDIMRAMINLKAFAK